MDPRFLQESGRQTFTGNELILKVALEAGVALLTGYPGSPVADVFEAVGRIAPYLEKTGVVAQIANNEGLAAARLNGARIAGLRAMAVVKSVGMHVAADGLADGNLAETRRPEGGALVVVGDDPWNETTQIQSDSRYLSQHLHMPVVEPATFQEVKDWLDAAFDLSGASDLYLTYIMTTNLADGGGVVTCRPNRPPPVNARRKAALSSDALPVQDLVMIPPHTSMREATMAGRFERLLARARELGLNRVISPAPSGESTATRTASVLMTGAVPDGAPVPAPGGTRGSVGFMAAGLSYCYLSQALEKLGLEDVPVLKWGVTYPLDEDLLLEFARRMDHIVIVEEKRDFLEQQVVAALHRAVQAGKLPRVPGVWGKTFPHEAEGFPSVRGLNTAVVAGRLAPLLKTLGIQGGLKALSSPTPLDARVVPRTPTFCPGCPHRDSAMTLKSLKRDLRDPAYMARVHGGEPMDVVFHGESGCHSMLQFEPYLGLMQDYSGMGLGGGTGAGMDPFVANKQVVFLGDSTFFHSGVIAVSDSIKNNQDITYVILQNGTTAMTGHQPTPGGPEDVMGRPTFSQDIETIVRGFGRLNVPVTRVHPADPGYRALLEDMILKPGVKVVVADKEFGITYHRRLRRERRALAKEKGFIPVEKVFNVTPEVCEDCRLCVEATGCPGLAIEETLNGTKITTDLSHCVADGACARGKVCPSFEEITIYRKKAGSARVAPPAVALPPVHPPRLDGLWCAYTAGVGGMGAGVVTAILAQAGLRQGYHVLFADKKGLAIRNGGVFGHVIFSNDDRPRAPLVPYGRADLLVGLDLLESARALDEGGNQRVASRDRTVAVVNLHKTPTVRTLLGLDNPDRGALEAALRRSVRPDRSLFLDFARVSERYFGNALYVNVIMLGAAWQRGVLPLSWENLEEGVRRSVPPADMDENLKALDLGRRAAARPDLFDSRSVRRSFQAFVEDKADLLSRNRPWGGRRLAQDYRKILQEASRWMDLPEADRILLAQFTYDLMMFEGSAYARRYLERLWAVYRRDSAARSRAAMRAVMENLPRTMAIKDEVYVAGLLTSEEKYRRDRERWGLDPSRGDRTEYVHLNRPRFTFLGKDYEFDWKSRPWQLRIMRHLRFLRRLLPGWHAEERKFRAWYEGIVDGFQPFGDEAVYKSYIELLRLPEKVKGYREVRSWAMREAYARAAEIQKTLPPHPPVPSAPTDRPRTK